MTPGRRTRVLLTERLQQLRVVHWLVLSVAIMVLEYYTGPFVQFAILLVFPVTIATALHGLDEETPGDSSPHSR